MNLQVIASNPAPSTRYLSCAETAKLVRLALKKNFSGTKFSVTSKTYSGGASISVSWVDGPNTKQVEAITSQYCGGDFDGSIDLKTSHSSWLMSDGSAIVADDYGTQGSMGCIPAEHNTKPEFKAEKVRFGADFIFCSRAYSLDVVKAAALEIAFKWNFELCPVIDSSWGARLDWNSKLKDQGTGFHTYDILVNRYLEGKK